MRRPAATGVAGGTVASAHGPRRTQGIGSGPIAPSAWIFLFGAGRRGSKQAPRIVVAVSRRVRQLLARPHDLDPVVLQFAKRALARLLLAEAGEHTVIGLEPEKGFRQDLPIGGGDRFLLDQPVLPQPGQPVPV